MANWCYNFVSFKGDNEGIKKVIALFTAMAEAEREEREGQLPDFIEGIGDEMYSIYCRENTASFDTAWAPNIEVIKQIADRYGLGFTQSYTEISMHLYGEYEYKDGTLTDICLDEPDFMLYDINPDDEDTWVFEGRVYENNVEILDILLDRKKALLMNAKN